MCVRSRPGRDCTAEFPELAAIAEALDGRRVILDGELVCLDSEGKPDFAALRNRLGRQPCLRSGLVAAVTLVIFDALHVDGRAVRELPYAARREMLASLESRRACLARAPALRRTGRGAARRDRGAGS